MLGSTNFDNSSFGLNDEVNIALVDRVLVMRLQQDFEQDLAYFECMTLASWLRPISERILAFLGIALERKR